jgi:hypothetical protein
LPLFNGQISLLVAVKILRAFFCSIGAGKIIEIKAPGFQLVLADPALSFRIQGYKDTSVPAQDIVYVPYVINVIAVQSVIIGDTAGIGTKFFIDPSLERRLAFKTKFFLRRGHFLNRLQTNINDYKRLSYDWGTFYATPCTASANKQTWQTTKLLNNQKTINHYEKHEKQRAIDRKIGQRPGSKNLQQK